METALVLPVFVFLILGLLQMGLMSHARVLTKYAAFKAVRAGAVVTAGAVARVVGFGSTHRSPTHTLSPLQSESRSQPPRLRSPPSQPTCRLASSHAPDAKTNRSGVRSGLSIGEGCTCPR